MKSLRLVALVLASLAIGAAAAALVLRSGGGGGGETRIDSCSFEGDSLVVTFTYGLNQRVDASVDLRGPDIVVSVRTESGEGDAPMIALLGRAAFSGLRSDQTVRGTDGVELACG